MMRNLTDDDAARLLHRVVRDDDRRAFGQVTEVVWPEDSAARPMLTIAGLHSGNEWQTRVGGHLHLISQREGQRLLTIAGKQRSTTSQ